MSESAAEAAAAQASDTAVVAEQPEGQGAAAVEVKQEAEVGDKAEDGKASEQTDSASAMLKTKARTDHKNIASNRKFDPSVRPDSSDPNEIRAQVEFYFGDSNLPFDKHMWTITGGVENKPVPLKNICAFGRMRCFKPYSAVVAALQDSKFLDISGAEGEEVVRRKKPYIAATDSNIARMEASVYVKGFGDEEPSTQFDIEAFFARYGPVNAIRLRRTDEKLFKGSVFAEFQTKEQAQKFLELDPPPTWKGHELLVMSKQAYADSKSKKIEAGEINPSSRGRKRFFEGREVGGHRGSGDPNDWKKRRENDQRNGFRDQRHGRGRGGRGGRGGGRGGRDSRGDRRERAEKQDNNGDKAASSQPVDSNGAADQPPSNG